MRVLTKKANKDYPQFGIKKGDTYFQWSFFRQRPIKSKTPPTRGQLTQNEVLQGVYAAYDGPAPKTADDVEAMAEQVREAGTAAQDKYDNLPENFQQGENGQRFEEQASNCESAADELSTIADELRDEEERVLPEKPAQDEGEDDDAYQARLDALLEQAGIDDSATYYEFDADNWTWALNEDALQEAVGTTEPELG